MTEGNAIGEFLRARRELLRPEDVGIPATSRRRVPGLRRSELAQLAGISSEYYVRLEQGRDTHPSAMVLDALARALQLDDQATAHLHQLATPTSGGVHQHPTKKIPADIEVLLRALDLTTSAYVTDRLMNVIAANRLATAVVPLLMPGTNFVRTTFLDPMAQEVYEDIAGLQAAAAAGLRAYAGTDVDDTELAELVGELSVQSPEFHRLWSRHDVTSFHVAHNPSSIRHPQLGPIELLHQKLEIPNSDGQILGLFYTEPGSRSERVIATLATAIRDLNTLPPIET